MKMWVQSEHHTSTPRARRIYIYITSFVAPTSFLSPYSLQTNLTTTGSLWTSSHNFKKIVNSELQHCTTPIAIQIPAKKVFGSPKNTEKKTFRISGGMTKKCYRARISPYGFPDRFSWLVVFLAYVCIYIPATSQTFKIIVFSSITAFSKQRRSFDLRALFDF